MRVPISRLIALALLGLVAQSASAQDATSIEAIAKAKLEANPTAFAQPGSSDGWVFSSAELKHLAHGAYWEKWEALGHPDPVIAIAKYASEIKDHGAQLLVVPVPAKAALYPEHLDASGTKPVSNLPFLKQLNDAGVAVLDLEKILSDAKAGGMKVYCEQDSHWSAEACQLIAKEIADGYRNAPWIGDPSKWVRSKPEAITVKGDLVADEQAATFPKETMTVVRAGPATESGAPDQAEVDRASPVLLLGDSHALVFHQGGEMLTTGAGLFDHLGAEFGLPLDRHASMGGASGPPRADLARRSRKEADLWEKKKLVIWVFTVRELTEKSWKIIPTQL